jgi:hypothetical protein
MLVPAFVRMGAAVRSIAVGITARIPGPRFERIQILLDAAAILA